MGCLIWRCSSRWLLREGSQVGGLPMHNREAQLNVESPHALCLLWQHPKLRLSRETDACSLPRMQSTREMQLRTSNLFPQAPCSTPSWGSSPRRSRCLEGMSVSLVGRPTCRLESRPEQVLKGGLAAQSAWAAATVSTRSRWAGTGITNNVKLAECPS